MVSNELIIELQDILKAEYCTTLETEEVSEIADFFVSFFGTLVQIESKNEHE